MTDMLEARGTVADKDAQVVFPTDEEIERAGWIKSSRRVRIIQSVPRVGQVYWVDFPKDAYAPEFVGEHPGIVVRGARKLLDTCIVIPMTTTDQNYQKHSYKMLTNPNPSSQKKGVKSYAVCDHLYTVQLCRLRPLTYKGRMIYPKVEPVDLNEIFKLVRVALARIMTQATPVAPQSPTPAKPPRPIGPNTLTLKRP